MSFTDLATRGSKLRGSNGQQEFDREEQAQGQTQKPKQGGAQEQSRSSAKRFSFTDIAARSGAQENDVTEWAQDI